MCENRFGQIKWQWQWNILEIKDIFVEWMEIPNHYGVFFSFLYKEIIITIKVAQHFLPKSTITTDEHDIHGFVLFLSFQHICLIHPDEYLSNANRLIMYNFWTHSEYLQANI